MPFLELSSSFRATQFLGLLPSYKKNEISAPTPLPAISVSLYINTSAPSLISRDPIPKFPASLHTISSFNWLPSSTVFFFVCSAGTMVDSMPDQSRSAPIVLGKRKEMMASHLGSSQREFEEPPNGTSYQVRVRDWKGPWTQEEDKSSAW